VSYFSMSTAVVKMEPKSEGIVTPRKKRAQGTCGNHRVLYGVRRIAGVCALLPGGGLHVLGAGRRSSAFWAYRGRSGVVHRLQEVHQAKVRKRISGWLPWDAIEMVAIEEVEIQYASKCRSEPPIPTMALDIQQKEHEGVTLLD